MACEVIVVVAGSRRREGRCGCVDGGERKGRAGVWESQNAKGGKEDRSLLYSPHRGNSSRVLTPPTGVP